MGAAAEWVRRTKTPRHRRATWKMRRRRPTRVQTCPSEARSRNPNAAHRLVESARLLASQAVRHTPEQTGKTGRFLIEREPRDPMDPGVKSQHACPFNVAVADPFFGVGNLAGVVAGVVSERPVRPTLVVHLWLPLHVG